MTGILDRIARRQAAVLSKHFRPATPGEFLALRLAQRLNDGPAVRHYIELCDRHPQAHIVAAYRHAAATSVQSAARSFHAALAIPNRSSNGLPHRDLAAIRIERRCIAVAIFSGQDLKYPPIARQLVTDQNKALGSAAMFINNIRAKCAFSGAAIEQLTADCDAHRSQLTRIVLQVLAEQQVAVWQFPKTDIIAAFGEPPLRFRADVRDVMTAMWPEVNGGFGSPFIKDALALGLYCQAEHVLSIEN